MSSTWKRKKVAALGTRARASVARTSPEGLECCWVRFPRLLLRLLVIRLPAVMVRPIAMTPWHRRLRAGLRYSPWRLCRFAPSAWAKYKAEVPIGQTRWVSRLSWRDCWQWPAEDISVPMGPSPGSSTGGLVSTHLLLPVDRGWSATSQSRGISSSSSSLPTALLSWRVPEPLFPPTPYLDHVPFRIGRVDVCDHASAGYRQGKDRSSRQPDGKGRGGGDRVDVDRSRGDGIGPRPRPRAPAPPAAPAPRPAGLVVRTGLVEIDLILRIAERKALRAYAQQCRAKRPLQAGKTTCAKCPAAVKDPSR